MSTPLRSTFIYLQLCTNVFTMELKLWLVRCVSIMIIVTVLIVVVLWNHSSELFPIDFHIKPRLELSKTTHSSNRNISGKNLSSYILTARYGGQQAAGLRGLISQQCFSHSLRIPVHIVEPFIVNSVLGHAQPDQSGVLKFSDLFDLHTFNLASAKSGYTPLITWENFLRNAPKETILVELQTGNRKRIYANSIPSCYRGSDIPKIKELGKSYTLCIVRVVHICCVQSGSSATPTVEELHSALFGGWKPEQVNLLFRHWSADWHIPATCKNFNLYGKVYPSQVILKHAKDYMDSFVKSNGSRIIAFVLRFEYLLAEKYDVDACMQNFSKIHTQLDIANASVFIAADIGKYRSESWKNSLSKLHPKKASQVMESFKNAVSLLIDNEWTFEEWENSFVNVTAEVEDAGYIATLQKTIASQADCIVFLVHGGNFQQLVMQEYFNQHPTLSERCVHYICERTLRHL